MTGQKALAKMLVRPPIENAAEQMAMAMARARAGAGTAAATLRPGGASGTRAYAASGAAPAAGGTVAGGTQPFFRRR